MTGRDDFEDSILNEITAATGDDLGSGEQTSESDSTDVGSQPNSRVTERVPVNEEGERLEQDKQLAPKKVEPPKTEQRQRLDKQGNIIDDKGNIIAKQGAERRLNDTIERQKAVLADKDLQLQSLRSQLEGTKSLDGLPAKYGLDTRDVTQAMEIAAIFKRDPVAGAQKAISFALAQGKSLQEIVNDEFIPNVSMEANRQYMEQRFGPLLDRQQQDTFRAENDRRAQVEASQFLLENPDAEAHAEDIAEMLPGIVKEYQGRGRSIDAPTASLIALQKLQQLAIKNGLDPRLAIGPQIERIKAGQAGRSPTADVRRNAQQPRQARPLPNGRGQPSHNLNDSPYASPDASTSDIVRQAMLESGYNL